MRGGNMAGRLTIPPLDRLRRKGVANTFGYCLKCRREITPSKSERDYSYCVSLGLVCPCQSVMLVEWSAAEDWPMRIDADIRMKYENMRFRLRMLAWQWETGRTLAGYWRV